MKRFLLPLFFTLTLSAQINFVAQKTTSLSSSTEVITLQQPASSTRNLVKLVSAYVDCTVPLTITLERNGSVATTLALTPKNVNPNETAPITNAFSGSDSTGGTVIQVVTISGGGSVLFDLSKIYFTAAQGPSSNFTIRTSSTTGTVHITLLFTEQ